MRILILNLLLLLGSQTIVFKSAANVLYSTDQNLKQYSFFSKHSQNQEILFSENSIEISDDEIRCYRKKSATPLSLIFFSNTASFGLTRLNIACSVRNTNYKDYSPKISQEMLKVFRI